MRLIAEQGEGFGGAHLRRRGRALPLLPLPAAPRRALLPERRRGRRAVRRPPLEVDWDAVYPLKTNARLADYPRDRSLHAAAVEFNASYGDFLALLTRRLQGSRELLIRGRGRDVPPARDDAPTDAQPDPPADGVNAAPIFEMPVRRRPPSHEHHRRSGAVFLGVSSTHTGFTEFQLQGTGQAARYLAAVRPSSASRPSSDLLDRPPAVRRRPAGDPEARSAGRCAPPSSATNGSARSPATSSSCGSSAPGTSFRAPGADVRAHEHDVTFIVSPAGLHRRPVLADHRRQPAGCQGTGLRLVGGPPRIPDLLNLQRETPRDQT